MNLRKLRNLAADKFETICFWTGRRGWQLVYVGRSKFGERSYRSMKVPGKRALACRVICDVSGWAMRACMEKPK